MVVHIGRSILLSGQSTPSCCPRLLACLVVSCTGPHRSARLPPLSAGQLLLKFVISGNDPTLFKKGCVNRFKALLPHVSPLFDSIFVLRNVACCLIPPPPLYMPTSMPVFLYPPFTLPPSLDKRFLTQVTFEAHTLSYPQLQPRNRTAFFNSGCPLSGKRLVPVSCSKLKQEGDDNGMDVVQSLSNDFTDEIEYQPFHYSVNRPAYCHSSFHPQKL